MAKRSDVMRRKDTGASENGVIGTGSKTPEKILVAKPQEVTIKTDAENPPIIGLKTSLGIGISHKHVQMSTRASLIVSENPKRNSVFIRNLSPVDVWIGESNVLAGLNGNGFPLKEDEVIMIDRSYGEIYGITEIAGTTAVVAVMEE